MGKSSGTAFLLWLTCLFGVCGLHRFYMGRYGTGVLWLLTFGLLGIGQFIDLFLINGMVRKSNREDPYTRLIQATLEVRAAPIVPPPVTARAPEPAPEPNIAEQEARVGHLRAAYGTAMPSRS